ncbi:uncharacterized protein LOC128338357 isoform X2 [Hemicordylus capensis]|uniref:uncharacterized protein LOC128338357 isoform X2 n=1 Tax=Hemicordylus capensis TaxID=884348 RepID=UPI002302FFB8|nr:uncharacterized protein LOC128338357 isoform X2 [Hemicordylus capensis]
MAEAAALLVRGRGAAPRETATELLSRIQRNGTMCGLTSPSIERSQSLHNDNMEGSSLVQGEMDSPSIDEMEESLRQLKLQVDSLASGASFRPDLEDTSQLNSSTDSSPFRSRWPAAPGGTGNYEELGTRGPLMLPLESEWYLKPTCLLQPHGDYSALKSLGIPTFASSPMNRVSSLLGSELADQNPVPSMDLTFPLKLGAPHVIGVKSLLPPKIPVGGCSPERAPPSLHDRGRSLSLDRTRGLCSESSSPASKRARWFRSRSQSPRPVWRPNSAKANACGQPPPQIPKPKGIRKKSGASRQSRSRIYRPGTLAVRSRTPTREVGRGTPSSSWSPYSLPSAAISSPTAEEINKRFLQTLAEGAIGRSLVEMSPYQQELARLRLERLRMEEAWLLELKRQQELERTRGPKPKWYEMRDSQFHYEARKNNELLRNSQDVQPVCNYRRELATASQEFQQRPNRLESC